MHAGQKNAGEQPGEREVAMMATEGSNMRGGLGRQEIAEWLGRRQKAPSSEDGAE